MTLDLSDMNLHPAWIFDAAEGVGEDHNPAAHGTTADGGVRGFDHTYGDGYDFIGDAEQRGWGALSSWGVDGWDLGDWPYVVLVARPVGDGWALTTRCEGDLTLYRFPDRAAFVAKVDELARYWWRQVGRGPSEADLASRPAEDFSGPYRVRA